MVKMKDNNILVAYFTKGGASEEYAKVIADTLTSQDLSVDLCNLAEKTPEIEAYTTLILGTGVRMFRVYRRWKKVLKQQPIKDKQVYLFLSSGMAAEEPEKAVEKFLQPIVDKYHLNVESMTSFPGKIPEKWAKYDDSPQGKMDPELAKTWANTIGEKIQQQ
jgi:menaquinone-dependent protoporphyrinogen IX oxidase